MNSKATPNQGAAEAPQGTAKNTEESPEITVAITCYNEEEFIVDSIENVMRALDTVGCSYEIVVVDDASTDNSVHRITECLKQNANSHIRLKSNAQNRGLANNIMEAALIARGKYFRPYPGDDSEPLDVLIRIFSQIGKADIVIPYQDQSQVVGKTQIRKIISVLFTRSINLITGYRIKYYNGNAIHLRSNMIRWSQRGCGFGFQADVITRLLDESATFIQVPSFSIDRKGRASSAPSFKNVALVVRMLFHLTIRTARRMLSGAEKSRPLEVFYSDEAAGFVKRSI